MTEILLATIIGGTFGFLGALLSIFVNAWMESRRAKRRRLDEVRLRLIGDRIQTSEVLDFIRPQRKRKWPRFWEREQADLSRANLAEIDLRGQDLRGIIFFRAQLDKADLDNAVLRRADLSKANLAGANLRTANLAGANLEGANLAEANLIMANLSEANLAEANLEGANLIMTNLEGASLIGANLSGTNLILANQMKANLERARYNDLTRWPANFDPIPTGAIREEPPLANDT